MGKIRFNVSLSLDGYLAGPDQSEENPLGFGGNWLSLVPLLIGYGERPLDGLPAGIEIDLEDVVAAPNVTHLKYNLR
jgi:hypothetical protein